MAHAACSLSVAVVVSGSAIALGLASVVTGVPAASAVALASTSNPAPGSGYPVSVLSDNFVGSGYDPAIPPGHPSVARLLQLINPITAAESLLRTIGQGIDSAFESLGAPPAVSIPAPKT